MSSKKPTVTNVNWVTNARQEWVIQSVLTCPEIGFDGTFRIEEVDLSQIDLQENAAYNMARPSGAVDEGYVASWIARMETTEPIPMIVLGHKDGKYYVLDGIHRAFAALRVLLKCIVPCYVVEMESVEVQRLASIAFNPETLAFSSKDKVVRAYDMHVNHGISVIAAALICGLKSPSNVHAHKRARDTEAVLAEMAIKPGTIKADAVLEALAPVRNRNVLRAIAVLAIKANLAKEAVHKIVIVANKKGISEREALDFVSKQSEIYFGVAKQKTKTKEPTEEIIKKSVRTNRTAATRFRKIVSDCCYEVRVTRNLNSIGIHGEEADATLRELENTARAIEDLCKRDRANGK